MWRLNKALYLLQMIVVIITFNIHAASPVTSSCGSPGRPAHGHATIVKTSFFAGQTVEFVCEQGFVIVGANKRQCLDNGTWSGQIPFCVTPSPTVKYTQSGISTCTPYFARVVDGDVETCVNIYVNHSTTWWIMDLSQLDDDVTILELLIKVEIPVEREFSFDTLQIHIADTTKRDYNSHLVRCELKTPRLRWEKYSFRLPTEKGQQNGRFLYLNSDTPATFSYLRICEVIFITAEHSHFSCGDPEVPLNGVVNRKEMHTAIYQCDDGFELSGDAVRTCTDDNEWSLPVAQCIQNFTTTLAEVTRPTVYELPSRPLCENSTHLSLTQEQPLPSTFSTSIQVAEPSPSTTLQVATPLPSFSNSVTEEAGPYFHIAVGVSVFFILVVAAFTIFLCHTQHRQPRTRNSSIVTSSTGETLLNDTYCSTLTDDFALTIANHYAEHLPQPDAVSSRRNSRLPSCSSSNGQRTSICSDSHSKKHSSRHSSEVRERERPPMEIKPQLPRANSTNSLIPLPDGPHIYAEICDNQLPPTPMLRRSHPVDRPPSNQPVLLSPVYSEPDDINNEQAGKQSLPIYSEPYGTQQTMRLC